MTVPRRWRGTEAARQTPIRATRRPVGPALLLPRGEPSQPAASRPMGARSMVWPHMSSGRRRRLCRLAVSPFRGRPGDARIDEARLVLYLEALGSAQVDRVFVLPKPI